MSAAATSHNLLSRICFFLRNSRFWVDLFLIFFIIISKLLLGIKISFFTLPILCVSTADIKPDPLDFQLFYFALLLGLYFDLIEFLVQLLRKSPRFCPDTRSCFSDRNKAMTSKLMNMNYPRWLRRALDACSSSLVGLLEMDKMTLSFAVGLVSLPKAILAHPLVAQAHLKALVGSIWEL